MALWLRKALPLALALSVRLGLLDAHEEPGGVLTEHGGQPRLSAGAAHAGGAFLAEEDARPEAAAARKHEAPREPGGEVETEKAPASGRKHKEGKEEKPPSEVMVAIAVLLFGFLIMNISLLYLVNFNDADVRSYVYKMLCVVVTIFCAVLINQAMHAFITEQLLEGTPPLGLGIKVGTPENVLVNVGMFFFWVALTYFICWHIHNGNLSVWRRSSDLYGIKAIGAHLIGFAGIVVFTLLQQEVAKKTGPAVQEDAADQKVPAEQKVTGVQMLAVGGVVLLAWGCLSLLRFGTHRIRFHCMSSEEDSADERHDDWMEVLVEAEDEATVFILSWLSNNVIAFPVVKRVILMEGVTLPPSQNDVIALLGFAFLFALLVVGTTVVRARMHTSNAVKNRVAKNVLDFMAMSVAWSLRRTSEWQIQISFPRQVEGLPRVVNAFAVSALSVVAIIVLDCCADAVRKQGAASSEAARGEEADAKPLARTPLRSRTAMLDADAESELDRLVVPTERFMENSHLEKALRTIISSFGLLVGFAWEAAYESCDHIVVTGVPLLSVHPVIAKLLIAGTLIAFVLKAWLRYIVPKAQLTYLDFEARILVENAEERSGANSSEDS